jgi:hypothetical protein
MTQIASSKIWRWVNCLITLIWQQGWGIKKKTKNLGTTYTSRFQAVDLKNWNNNIAIFKQIKIYLDS